MSTTSRRDYRDDGVWLMEGDCLARMREIPEGSVDAVVTDPPAGISFMNKSFDSNRGGRDRWIKWLAARLAEAYRVAKPGAYALVWALPRTSHWTATAIEDAGWSVRDRVVNFLPSGSIADDFLSSLSDEQARLLGMMVEADQPSRLQHLFGTGFPKAKSCLKPACEDWWLAWKPAGKVTPLQIDACRIEGVPESTRFDPSRHSHDGWRMNMDGNETARRASEVSGRWPAHTTFQHSPSCRPIGTRRVKGDPRPGGEGDRPGGFGDVGAENGDGKPAGKLYGDAEVEVWQCEEGCPVGMLDRQSGIRTSGKVAPHYMRQTSKQASGGGYGGGFRDIPLSGFGDSGGASRFFFVAKASKADRGEGNTHPTVKSCELMRWIARLICPPAGIILDPFMGSGSTGKAAIAEGFRFIGIESDPDYFPIALARIQAARAAAPLFANLAD